MISVLQIAATILAVVVLIFAIVKNYNTATSLLFIGLILLAAMTLITGQSMAASSSGNIFLDIFELCNEKFSSQLSGTVLLIMSVMGYVTYMNHMKASKLLAYYASKPLKKLKSPYIILTLAILISAVLKLFVPSHSGLTALLMATLYPVLISAGINKVTAASTVVIGGMYDMGPSCPLTSYCMTLEEVASRISISAFFIQYQIPATLCVIAVSVILFLIVTKWANKKHSQSEETAEVDSSELEGVPKFYAILPCLPLIFVLIFSDLVMKTISLSVVAANVMSFIIAFIIDLIFSKKGNVATFNDTQKFWEGMGTSFTTVGSLAVGGAVFTAGLEAIGGTSLLLNSIAGSSLGGILTVVAASLIGMFMSVFTGSSVAAIYAVAPLLPQAALASGVDILMMLVPVLSAGGLGRAIAPVSGTVIIACSVSGVSPVDIIKRNIIPVIGGLLTVYIVSFLLF